MAIFPITRKHTLAGKVSSGLVAKVLIAKICTPLNPRDFRDFEHLIFRSIFTDLVRKIG